MKPRRVQQWIANNKLVIVFGLLAVSFFASTIALAQRKGGPCMSTDKAPNRALSSSNNGDSEIISYRLPRHVIPLNYKLRLEPTLGINKTFTGSVEIQLNVLESTHNVTLHSGNLGIISVNLINAENARQNMATQTETVADKRELLIIKTEEELTKGRYIVRIEFSGKLDGLVGFYGSTLKNGRAYDYFEYWARTACQPFLLANFISTLKIFFY